MKNIQIIKSNKSTMQLSNGHTVYPEFLEIIRSGVTDRIPILLQNKTYTLEQICGESLWDELKKGEKIMAGWCMKHLVTTGELPLIVAESKHEYPVYYQLR